MAYVRKKRVRGREYYQLVESHRVDGKPRQKVLAHLGRYRTVEEALEDLPRRIDLHRRTLLLYPARMRPGRERTIAALEERLFTLRRLREQGVV